jgi:oligopeptide/dipeptide ABC transporter ATP-binding protein
MSGSWKIIAATVPRIWRGLVTYVFISHDLSVIVDPPSGCRFRTRCAFVMPRCAEAIPPPVAVGDAHHVACYLFDGEPSPMAA